MKAENEGSSFRTDVTVSFDRVIQFCRVVVALETVGAARSSILSLRLEVDESVTVRNESNTDETVISPLKRSQDAGYDTMNHGR